MRFVLLLGVAALLVGCGDPDNAPDPGNAAMEKAASSRLHAGPTAPKPDGVAADGRTLP